MTDETAVADPTEDAPEEPEAAEGAAEDEEEDVEGEDVKDGEVPTEAV